MIIVFFHTTTITHLNRCPLTWEGCCLSGRSALGERAAPPRAPRPIRPDHIFVSSLLILICEQVIWKSGFNLKTVKKSDLEKHAGSGRWSLCLESPIKAKLSKFSFQLWNFELTHQKSHLHFQLSYNVPRSRGRRGSWSWDVVLVLGEAFVAARQWWQVRGGGGPSEARIFGRGGERGGGDYHLGASSLLCQGWNQGWIVWMGWFLQALNNSKTNLTMMITRRMMAPSGEGSDQVIYLICDIMICWL